MCELKSTHQLNHPDNPLSQSGHRRCICSGNCIQHGPARHSDPTDPDSTDPFHWDQFNQGCQAWTQQGEHTYHYGQDHCCQLMTWQCCGSLQQTKGRWKWLHVIIKEAEKGGDIGHTQGWKLPEVWPHSLCTHLLTTDTEIYACGTGTQPNLEDKGHSMTLTNILHCLEMQAKRCVWGLIIFISRIH